MHLKTKLYLVNDSDEKYMGLGVLWLLENIEKFGSLRKASKELKISYSKAYNMICNLENNLNCDILIREKGGSTHKGSSLTNFAIDFCSLYRDFQAKAKKELEDPYNKFKNELDLLIDKEKK